MNGFLMRGDTERLPANFIEGLPRETDPRMLYKSEWRIVMDLAKKVIEVKDACTMLSSVVEKGVLMIDEWLYFAVLREEAFLRSERTAGEVLRDFRSVADGFDAPSRAR